MKIIVVVLLVMMGAGLIALAAFVKERVSGAGFKPPQAVWSKKPQQEQAVSTGAIVRFMRVAGALLLLAAAAIGWLWRS